MSYFQTKNGIVKIGKHILKEGYKVYKDPLGSSGSGNEDSTDRKRPNAALLTYSTDQLISDMGSDIDTRNVPTSSMTVQTEPAWDYIPNYEQNSFDVTRFTYQKPSQKTISLEGNYLTPSTSNYPNSDTLDTFYMFNTFPYDFMSMAANPYAYSFSFLDTIPNTAGKEIKLGRGMLPQSFSIKIAGIDNVQDAVWTAKFIGPYDFGNNYNQNAPASPIKTNSGLRALNTKDFVVYCTSNNILSALISFDLSIQIEWEKKATNSSYLSRDFAPNWRWWGMNNMTGECVIKMILPLSVVLGPDVGAYAWPVIKRFNWTSPKIYSPTFHSVGLDPTLTLPHFFWQTPSIDFQSENLAIISYKGVLHNGTVTS